MGMWGRAVLVAAMLLSGLSQAEAQPAGRQPIIDVHRHTPWPGESDAEGLALIREEMRRHHVVAAALFVTGREDVAHYRADERTRFLLSPMFPCPALTVDRKWCFTETDGLMPDAAWLDGQLAAGALGGIGELVFNYAAVPPDAPAMAPYWALAAKHDAPAFVHTGRGPGPGQGPRRRPDCCPDYRAEYGDPALLRPVLARHPTLRVVLQHAGFDYVEETIALMRDFPNVYAEMSVLNSIGPPDLHDASLRRFVDAGLADRILLGSDDQDYAPIIERIEGASFLTPEQRRGIYYDNAARFLRLDEATIRRDHAP
ncbi:MAG TPA: amidohydrolase family protein [Phenylobacterium sp.]|nr:amidohydrolase family protein [Phenylobacterium sp.]